MTTMGFWCSSFLLCVVICCTMSAPPDRVPGNPYPFYQKPYPEENGDLGGVEMDRSQFDTPVSTKRNPAPPSQCVTCCQDFWCSYINTRCLCSPPNRWNIGP